MHAIPRRPITPAFGLVDFIYATPWVLGALLLHDIPRLLTLTFIPLFIASWWQDWRSARAAASYFSGELVGFDVLTAGNYIGIVDGWRRPVPHGALISTPTLVHWAGIFIIYIAWNLAIVKKADAPTRRAFIAFSLGELPLALIGMMLVAAQVTGWREPGWLQPVGIGALAIGHASLLALWRVMSRKGGDG